MYNSHYLLITTLDEATLFLIFFIINKIIKIQNYSKAKIIIQVKIIFDTNRCSLHHLM